MNKKGSDFVHGSRKRKYLEKITPAKRPVGGVATADLLSWNKKGGDFVQESRKTEEPREGNPIHKAYRRGGYSGPVIVEQKCR